MEVCWNSRQRVSIWCVEQGIAVSTYYNWQRKVYQAVLSESEIYFAELSIRPAKADTAASIRKYMALYQTLYYFLTSFVPLQGAERLDAYESPFHHSALGKFLPLVGLDFL